MFIYKTTTELKTVEWSQTSESLPILYLCIFFSFKYSRFYVVLIDGCFIHKGIFFPCVHSNISRGVTVLNSRPKPRHKRPNAPVVVTEVRTTTPTPPTRQTCCNLFKSPFTVISWRCYLVFPTGFPSFLDECVKDVRFCPIVRGIKKILIN